MRRGLISLAVLLLAGLAIWRATRPPPRTDEQLIRALFEEAVKAAEEKRVSDAVAGVSERFQGQGLDRRGLKQLVLAKTLRAAWAKATLANLEVAVAGETATARFDLILVGGGEGQALADLLPSQGSAWSVEARLEREREGWRVVGASWVEASARDAPRDAPRPGEAPR
jgi:hypothetical protein